MNGYLLTVAAASVLVSVVQSFLPKSAVQRVSIFASGLLLIIVVLTPILCLNPSAMPQMISELLIQAEGMESTVQTGNQELMAKIIQERCEAYISDKATSLGISLQVEVELKEGDEYPYPYRVSLRGAFTDQQKALLTEEIANNLGIPAQRQEWISM